MDIFEFFNLVQSLQQCINNGTEHLECFQQMIEVLQREEVETIEV